MSERVLLRDQGLNRTAVKPDSHGQVTGTQ
jgi:hypothetical protein